MKKFYLSIFLIFVCVFAVKAQTYNVLGKVIDDISNTPLIGVNVVIKKSSDSSNIFTGSLTNEQGDFLIEKLKEDSYIIESSYLGYKLTKQAFSISNKDIDLGVIRLQEDSKLLNEVLVKGKQISVQIDGDTTKYNASSYKVNLDATTEDLLVKMPGISTENGTLTVNGEEVQKILIDGKPFFGDNPQTAIKNLPANVINQIMVFDDMSDMSKFSGYNDGNTTKTINIITKNGISHSSFGRMNVGYGGQNNRYDAGLNYSNFKADRRITILGLSNNVNQQNFLLQDIIDATASTGTKDRARMSGRMGSSVNNLMVDQQNGISTTHAMGINYGDKWGKKNKVSVAGSYFLNISNNSNSSNSIRNYLSETDSGFVYIQKEDETVKNYNNRLNSRIEYAIDTLSSLLINTSLNVQFKKTNSLLNAENINSDSTFLNSINNNRLLKPRSIVFDNSILYRRRLAKKGRTISFNFNSNTQNRNNFNQIISYNNVIDLEDLLNIDTLNQQIDINRKSYTLEGGVTYTEPIKEKGQISISYSSSYNKNNADRFTNDFSDISQSYTIVDTALSNQFINTYKTNKLALAYNFKHKNLDFNASITGQIANLASNQIFPSKLEIGRNFLSILPYFRLNYKISQTKNIRFFYRAKNSAPSVTQLQNVFDNSNPLILSSGNENLKQDFSYSFGLGYNQTNIDKATNLSFFTSASQTINYIANTTTIYQKDTIILNNEISPGTQIIKPINLNSSWNTRAYFLYGFPITKMKSNINFTSSFIYNQTPTLINENKNIARNYILRSGITIASNISEKIDFTVSYNATYNIINNSYSKQNNNIFFNHTFMTKVNYQFWKGFVLATNIRNTLNAGGSAAFNTSFWLADASLGYKFLKGENLELKFSTYDIFNQNRNIQRYVTEIYTEDVQSLALKRYYLATLTYTLKIKNDKEESMIPSESKSYHGYHP